MRKTLKNKGFLLKGRLFDEEFWLLARANGEKWFVVLHYPSELEGTDEEKKYTDVTRVYTLEDETGAVDGRGHAMMWPKHVEFGQALELRLMANYGTEQLNTTEHIRAGTRLC